jgi:hypothetical protein
VGTPLLGVRVAEPVAVAEQKYPNMTPTDFYMIAQAAESKLHRQQTFPRGSRFGDALNVCCYLKRPLAQSSPSVLMISDCPRVASFGYN